MRHFDFLFLPFPLWALELMISSHGVSYTITLFVPVDDDSGFIYWSLDLVRSLILGVTFGQNKIFYVR